MVQPPLLDISRPRSYWRPNLAGQVSKMHSFATSLAGLLRILCLCTACVAPLSLTLVFGQTASAQAVEHLDVKSTDRVFWRGKGGENYLIINVFANQTQINALDSVKRNTLLINTALKEGSLQLERPESSTLTSLNVLFVSMKDMSEYGGSNSNWTQVGTGILTKGTNKVEMKDIVLAGTLPSPLPTADFPYKEASRTTTAASVRFRMPDKLFLVVGQTLPFFYENLLVSKDIEDYVFTPSGNAVGIAAYGRRGLIFNALPAHVGEHDLLIKVADWAGKVVAEGATKVVVTAANMSWQPSPTEPVRILMVGHSLPSMYYPAYIADLLAGPGNPKVSFVGGIKYWYGKLPDFKNNPDTDTMYHQASPGYSVSTVLNLYTEEPPANPNMPAKSPFIFKDAAGKPTFNIKRYFAETLSSKSPHFVLLNIGDNDTFGYDPEKPDPAQEKLFVDNMNRFLNELREIAPNATFGAIMPNSYNYSDRSFLHNYGPNFPRFKQLQNRQRYIEMMSDIAKARGDLSIIPSNFSVDSIDGMPYNSGTHFNTFGAQQFSGSIYAWLKGQFALKGGTLLPVQQPAAGAAAAPVAVTQATAAPAAQSTQPVAERPGWFRRLYNRIVKFLSFQ
jgi:hypothetical protein